jgi:hypothetical protein
VHEKGIVVDATLILDLGVARQPEADVIPPSNLLPRC